jgi:hypothetical protein
LRQQASTGLGIGIAPQGLDGQVIVGINGAGYGLHPETFAGISQQRVAAFGAGSGALLRPARMSGGANAPSISDQVKSAS